jgi:hypothetical protein
MADKRHYPDRWNEYKKLKQRDLHEYDPQWLAFAVRYRMASSFHSTSFFGVGKNLSQIYSSSTQLALALAALEMAYKASRTEIEVTSLIEGDNTFISIATKIRKFLRDIHILSKDLSACCVKGNVHERLRSFMSGQHNDLVPAALILRNILCTGAWAPADSSMRFGEVASSIEELSRRILIKSDRIFEEFLEKIIRRQPPSAVK